MLHYWRTHHPDMLVVACDRHHHLSCIVSNHAWHFDLPTGTLSFGNQYRWQTQLLGTESEASNTWLWAWGNTESNIPAHLLVTSLALKAYGEQHAIPELTTPQLPLDQIDGHTLCEANAYYRCPYEGGALFVLIVPSRIVIAVFPELRPYGFGLVRGPIPELW